MSAPPPAKLGSGSRPPARPAAVPGSAPVNPAAVPVKVVKGVAGKPQVPPQPKKASTIKKTVNYERQMGVVAVPPTGQTVVQQQRKHSDTLASMPMQDKMKAFESAGAADSRRNFWIKRAEEKKAVAAKPKAPVGQAPRPPVNKAPTPQTIPPRDRDDPSRQSVRASPHGVGNLAKNFAAPNSPKAPPRVAAPKPPANKAPPKKTMTAPVAPPPVKRGPTAEDLRLQEEQELAAFEAEEAARAAEEERQRRAAAEEAARKKQEEERRKQEELRLKKEEEERRRKQKEEEEKRKREEEEKRKRELQEEEERKKRAAAAAAAQKKPAAAAVKRTRTVDLLVTLADYEGNGAEGELSFGENEYVLLMRRDDTGWWQGEINGVLGWVPSNFCRESTDDEFESYCAQCGIEPYVEEEKPPAKPEPPKAPEKKVAPAVVAAPAPAPVAVSTPTTSAKNPANAGGKSPSAAPAGTTMGTANGPNKLMQAFGKLPTSMDEFEIQGLLGKGRFGKVYQCRKKDTGHIYAIKALLKTHIESSEAQKILVEREKAILMKIKGPFLVRCYHIFEDSEKLYFVMECASGGELFVHLSREKIFDPERVRFYAAEMFLGLEYLHSLGIVYRDMKPENVLLTAEGHILMTDFGISKEGLDNNSMRTATFCGTPEYLAPEVLLGQGYGKAVDWWSYGSVCYEMLTGLPPYYSEDITEMYKKILQAPLEIPPECDKASRDFLTALLDRNPEKRLQDPKVIRRHPYFRGVDWDAMYNMRVPAPYIPPEEFVYDDEDENAPVEDDDAFADFDGQVYDDSIPDDGQLRCRSHHDWPGEAEGDLALRVGDVILVIDNQSDPDGWWTGECEADGRQGSFPSNFVQLI